jgi:DTW domain-containing protein YfiP
MQLFLLTHQRELAKATNTGSLVSDVLAEQVQVIVWQRKQPDNALIAEIEKGSTALLYPTEDSQAVTKDDGFDNYIVLDATWQEAQKMLNQSPYLKSLPKVQVTASAKSIYTLRRNQKPGGLCTAECVAELLKANGLSSTANTLIELLRCFITHRHSNRQPNISNTAQ